MSLINSFSWSITIFDLEISLKFGAIGWSCEKILLFGVRNSRFLVSWAPLSNEPVFEVSCLFTGLTFLYDLDGKMQIYVSFSTSWKLSVSWNFTISTMQNISKTIDFYHCWSVEGGCRASDSERGFRGCYNFTYNIASSNASFETLVNIYGLLVDVLLLRRRCPMQRFAFF